MLWLGGGVTIRRSGRALLSTIAGCQSLFHIFVFFQDHQSHPDNQENNNEFCLELLADIALFLKLITQELVFAIWGLCWYNFSLPQGKTSWPSTTNCLTIFNKCYGPSGKMFASAASVCSIGLIMDMNQYSYVSKPPSFCNRKQSQSPQRPFILLSIFIDFAGIRSVAVCRSLPWLIYLANNVT